MCPRIRHSEDPKANTELQITRHEIARIDTPLSRKLPRPCKMLFSLLWNSKVACARLCRDKAAVGASVDIQLSKSGHVTLLVLRREAGIDRTDTERGNEQTSAAFCGTGPMPPESNRCEKCLLFPADPTRDRVR